MVAAEKQCCRCRVVKPVDAFHRKFAGGDERQAHCKRCHTERTREWRHATKRSLRTKDAVQRADETGAVRCAHCGEHKDPWCFSTTKCSDGRTRPRTNCKPCHAEIQAEYRARVAAEALRMGGVDWSPYEAELAARHDDAARMAGGPPRRGFDDDLLARCRHVEDDGDAERDIRALEAEITDLYLFGSRLVGYHRHLAEARLERDDREEVAESERLPPRRVASGTRRAA